MGAHFGNQVFAADAKMMAASMWTEQSRIYGSGTEAKTSVYHTITTDDLHTEIGISEGLLCMSGM